MDRKRSEDLCECNSKHIQDSHTPSHRKITKPTKARTEYVRDSNRIPTQGNYNMITEQQIPSVQQFVTLKMAH
jgi:hypothetical protein